ncbi:hypothetical protein H8Z72_22650 (plasmid) [Xanthomonas citri pv. citri]|uniref:hypothetical protein n=1 Tax=Xanthomonas citri TaxID=346 RepID=UPI0019339FC8|nr:hypothetical protein [Xanthomonas citri]QRD62669.1 hypothetical protein H8Z74_23535 [Xanthomonas citri pv. citri]QRD67204.1 hypothetical protein H8Z73_22515 [Xanthomonas citri pv. citri]QRD71751.1 hypothetical protein H8Z72_22650 [Xanthomonas citri pv. citri]
MRNASMLQELLDHVPLSQERRDQARVVRVLAQLRFNVHVAHVAATLVAILGISLAVASGLGTLSWKQAAILLGFSFLAIGTLRAMVTSMAQRAFETAVAGLRPLTDLEALLIDDILNQHPEVGAVLDQWKVDADLLTITELDKLRSYCRRQAAGEN